MPGCSAVGCSNRTEQGFALKVFPKDPQRRKLWAAKVKRLDWEPTNSSFLCEIHFDADQWIDFSSKKLKKTAVPTLFAHRPDNFKRKAPNEKVSEPSKRLCLEKEGVKRIGDHIPLKREPFRFKGAQLAVLKHYYEKDALPDCKTREQIVAELNEVAKRSGGERVYLPVVTKWFKRTRSNDLKKLRQQHGLLEVNNNGTVEKPRSSKDECDDSSEDEIDEKLEEELNILEKEKQKLEQALFQKEMEEKRSSMIKKLTEIKFIVEQALEEVKTSEFYREETLQDTFQVLHSKMLCLKS